MSYAGEVATCRPLADPSHLVAHLKSTLVPYPTPLRDALVNNLWQADFYVQAAAKGIPKNDIAYIQLCCTSALMLCAHAWHAAAGQWATNEKGLVVDVASLTIDTHNFSALASEALATPSASPDDLIETVQRTTSLVRLTQESLRAG